MVETLNELAQLRDSGFGRPRPRHGLKLLYWFATEFISFEDNNEMYSEYDPDERHYGFHSFENRYDDYGEKLLPDVEMPYYVVGNLNKQGAYQPFYISEDNSTLHDDSNTDRIIVSIDDGEWIERVYVTRHSDKSNYDPDATFRISRGLLLIIRKMNLVEFLDKTGYYTQTQLQIPVQAVSPIPFIYRPQTPTSITKTTTTVTPASLPPAHQHVSVDMEPPPTPQTNDTIITVTKTTTTVTPASLPPAHQHVSVDMEPPPTPQTNGTTIQTFRRLEKAPLQKRSCGCTIL